MTANPSDLGRLSHLEALLAAVGPVAALTIADIGCGEGALDKALAANGAIVIGYDPFMAPTERKAEGAGSWRIERAAADAIPAPDASFDLVVFVFSLHHVPRAKLPGAMSEARRLLRPGGRLYVAEPIAEGPNQRIVELFHDETAVRAAANEALSRHADPYFTARRELLYSDLRCSAAFDIFARRMIANMRFNGYTEAAVLAPEVRSRFAETDAIHHGEFDQPVRVNLYG
jgi:SAM-dependent methyltransferase